MGQRKPKETGRLGLSREDARHSDAASNRVNDGIEYVWLWPRFDPLPKGWVKLQPHYREAWTLDLIRKVR